MVGKVAPEAFESEVQVPFGNGTPDSGTPGMPDVGRLPLRWVDWVDDIPGVWEGIQVPLMGAVILWLSVTPLLVAGSEGTGCPGRCDDMEAGRSVTPQGRVTRMYLVTTLVMTRPSWLVDAESERLDSSRVVKEVMAEDWLFRL